MSSKRKVRYKNTNRAKGAAIVLANSAEYSSAKRRNKRNLSVQLIVIAVALIESVLLVLLSSFSWIESTSSLIIRGDNMPITENNNYEVVVGDTDHTETVDLHDFFNDVAFFRFAKASSPDGTNFYFPKFATSGIGAVAEPGTTGVINGAAGGYYRKGDTADYNTAYYNIDFRITNENTRGYKYYFANDTLFTVTGATDSAVNTAAEKCYRLAVQVGDVVTIYANNAVTYTAANTSEYAVTSTSDASTKASVTAHASSLYAYSDNSTTLASHTEVCSVDGETSVDLTFRVWFEVNDPEYLKLTDEQKAQLDHTQVDVDFTLKNTSSDVRSFYFSDYSRETAAGLAEDPDFRMFFVYYDDGSISLESPSTAYIPMIPVETEGDYIYWRTANNRLRGADMITKEMLDTMESSYGSCYFCYASLDEEGAFDDIVYKWAISEPVETSGGDGTYDFISYGVTGNSTYDENNCFGAWRGDTTVDNTPTLVLFDDKMAEPSASANYNIGAESPITEGSLYLSTASLAATAGTNNANLFAVAEKTTRMYYNADLGKYQAYLPAEYAGTADTFYFYYQSGTFNALSSAAGVTFTSTGRPDETAPVYKAYGYSGTGTLAAQSCATGYGTWGTLQRLNFSAELVDHLIDPAYRFRMTVTVNSADISYYMAGEADTMLYYAYAPGGTTAAGFAMYEEYSDTTAAAAWAKSSRGTSDTFYPVNFESAATGYWNVAVLVDGTRDNLINTILTENSANASLQYSTDGGSTYTDMVKIDNTRWCAGGYSESLTSLQYRFIAYTGSEVNDRDELLGYSPASFIFTHTLADGRYYTVTE